jgi:hypothetical protein
VSELVRNRASGHSDDVVAFRLHINIPNATILNSSAYSGPHIDLSTCQLSAIRQLISLRPFIDVAHKSTGHTPLDLFPTEEARMIELLEYVVTVEI